MISSDEESEDESQPNEVNQSHQSKQMVSSKKSTETTAGVAKGSKLKCVTCDKVFHFVTDYDKHLVDVHNYRPYRCTQCNKSFTRKYNLNSHIRKVHNKETRFKCDFCGQQFFDKIECKRHVNIHVQQGQYQRISHTKTHTKERLYECAHCHKQFALKSSLAQHKARKICLKKSNLVNNAENAKTAMQEEKDQAANCKVDNWYTCEECTKSFQFITDYQTHLLSEHTFAPFRCAECGGVFKKRGNLERHQRIVHKWGAPQI